MTQDRPSFEELNAYVDNELPANRSADVAQAIARYPDVAEKVATLARLRSVLATSVETPALALPQATKPRLARAPWLAAACVALVCVCSALLLAPFGDQGGSRNWMEAAWKLHDGWTPPTGAVAKGAADRLIQASSQRADIVDAYVPDLSASKLSVAYVDSEAEVLGAPAIVIGYTGTRGCKLTLIASPALGQASSDPRLYSEGGKSAYGWRVGKIEHLLVADGMDPARFDLIAESIYRASIERLPFDDEVRTALVENRQNSKPCHA